MVLSPLTGGTLRKTPLQAGEDWIDHYPNPSELSQDLVSQDRRKREKWRKGGSVFSIEQGKVRTANATQANLKTLKPGTRSRLWNPLES
jgi:hypothetical protein